MLESFEEITWDYLNITNSSALCTAEIAEIGPNGKLSVEFNTDMKTDFDIALLDTSVMELSIIVSNERLA